jgi:MFS family permease
VTTVFGRQYGAAYSGSVAAKNVAAIAFAGTVVGQLIFGFTSDHWSRTNSLVISTIILIVFTALATGSYYHGSTVGLFNILTAWRFFVGIGIGGKILSRVHSPLSNEMMGKMSSNLDVL